MSTEEPAISSVNLLFKRAVAGGFSYYSMGPFLIKLKFKDVCSKP